MSQREVPSGFEAEIDHAKETSDAPGGAMNDEGMKETADGADVPEQNSFGWDPRLERVLEEWRLRAWAGQIAHYRVASHLRRYNVWLGLPVVILTTAVGTSLFATLNQEDLSLGLRIFVGGISLAAAVLAGAQTFFSFAQRADQHVIAADWYASIRRKIEQLQATPRKWRESPKESLDVIRKEMNNVGSQSPEIGERTWEEVSSSFGVREPPPRGEAT
jgi:hypothetical protein